MMSSDCVDALTRYLKGGDRASYGDGKDPFKRSSVAVGVSRALPKHLQQTSTGWRIAPMGRSGRRR